jgi:uncharacterized protein (DUF2141 family)
VGQKLDLTREDLMRSASYPIAVALLAASAVTASAQGANRVGVTVTGLRSDAGVVRCGLYANPGGFPQPGREARGTVARISGNQATCVFANMPPGTYAVAAFHAEQNETRMQYGAFGKPKQGYGFSGNPSSSFGAPSFSAASFDYRGGTQSLQVKLQY